MRNILFIINPEAGGGRSGKVIDIIEKKMRNSKYQYNIMLTKGPNEATDIAKGMLEDYTDIVAVGGDGTVNEVARALIEERSAVLGIIPSGTGNDFSLSLGIPSDPKKALDILLEENREITNIDVCSINNRPYLNISTLGFDANVVETTNKIKKVIRNGFAYIIGVFINLISFRKNNIDLTIDGKSYNIESFLLAIGNGKYYGGGLPIMPSAELNNEYLEVCSIKDISNLKVLQLFPSIFKGNHIKYDRYISIYRAKEVIVNTEKPMILNIDGEVIKNNKNEIVFKVEEYKLPVVTKLK